MDAILQINLIYFSPHHKNKFVNSVNSLKQFGRIGRNKNGKHARIYSDWSA